MLIVIVLEIAKFALKSPSKALAFIVDKFVQTIKFLIKRKGVVKFGNQLLFHKITSGAT